MAADLAVARAAATHHVRKLPVTGLKRSIRTRRPPRTNPDHPKSLPTRDALFRIGLWAEEK